MQAGDSPLAVAHQLRGSGIFWWLVFPNGYALDKDNSLMVMSIVDTNPVMSWGMACLQLLSGLQAAA